jgi:phosphatidylserine decarboxylase
MVFLWVVFKGSLWLLPLEILLFLVFLWMLSFFRDPVRNVKLDETVLYSPADGTITDISPVDEGQSLRIGIFLSVFNVHINRAPCSVRIDELSYKKGQFKNAFSPEAGRVNESNDITATRLAEPVCRLMIRQISGAIARHIVCEARLGDEYRQGQAFGMIKFGSRTELQLPSADSLNYDVLVKAGDKVRAGLTPLVRFRL